MITRDQLDILRDIFAESDDEWLLLHLSLRDTGNRNFEIRVDNANSQDYDELLGNEPQE